MLEVRLFVQGELRILDYDINFPLLWFSVLTVRKYECNINYIALKFGVRKRDISGGESIHLQGSVCITNKLG